MARHMPHILLISSSLRKDVADDIDCDGGRSDVLVVYRMEDGEAWGIGRLGIGCFGRHVDGGFRGNELFRTLSY